MASLEEGAPPHSAHTQASSSQPGSSLSNDPPPLSALAMLEAGENLKMRPLFSNSPKQDLIIDWADEESESEPHCFVIFRVDAWAIQAYFGALRKPPMYT